jgi:hypothetical protein
MKKVAASAPKTIDGIYSKLMELCGATSPETEEIADTFAVSNFTPTRTLNVSTATLTDLKNVVATFIHDMQQRGSTRTNG